MENLNPNQWSEVKKIKFHHRVKRFYHKDLFRKIYTVAIIGLIGANVFSLVKYYSVADELEMLDDTQPVVQDTSENDVEGEDENLLTDIDNDLQSGDIEDIFAGDTEAVISGDVVEISTGDIESNTGLDENTFTGDSELSTGVVENTLTGDIQEDSSLHSEGQDDAEQPLSPQQASDSSPSREQNSEGEDFSPDRGSGEAEGVNNTPMDSSSSSESQTLTKAQELQKAWETLNTGHIAGSSTYNGLRVSVNAPEGAFPQGTKLVIKPIDKGSKESVSFDISFIYTYSDGSTIELQPLKGKSVQVIFNYDENAEWKNAISKGQELKVKHKHNGDTEDVKFSNNGEGNLMIDTDKFSEYEFSLVKPTDIQTQGQEDVQNDTKVEELTGTALELAIARETLNSDPIEKLQDYNKVTVNVLAPANTFPEGTKLVIEAIKGDKLEEVKQKISDEPTNNIDEDAEIVAFDIRFEYELSDGSIVELQPKENTVQVTFDYSKNKELKKADQNENEEIEIYHINDKDENGQKVAEGEEVVEKIEINEEKSDELDNGVVIDAESFSYYTIVVQRAEENPTQTWKYGKDYDIITILKPSSINENGLPEGITIMDRNLGATSTDITNTNSYGYYYQWGNNYGFPYSATVSSVTNGLTWSDSYDNSGYYSTNFINGSSHDYDVWSDNTHHDGVWGGENDSADNGWGVDLKNYSDRQGPCPSGWHVPSAGEWGLLVKYWRDTYATGVPLNGSNNLYYFSDSTARQNFMDYFNIPFAGVRYYSTAALNYQGSYGYYWSSSPYGSDRPDRAHYLNLDSSNARASSSYGYRAYGFSVRCFKNSFEASPETSNLVDTQAWVEGEDFETITISNPDDVTQGFTIMDRNLGAKDAGTSGTGTYGFKYQWGNNYGFVDGCTSNGCTDSVTSSSVAVSATAGAIWNDVYNNHGYFGNTFIKSSSSSFGYDYWADNTRHNNLWGGGNDSADNGRGVTLNNPTDRQGPCPVGYHVPSAGEWGLLVKYYHDTYATNVTLNGSDNLYYFSDTTARTNFMKYFYIPFAGNRNVSNASLYNQGSIGYYWSSSPYSASSLYARYLLLNSSNVDADYYNGRANGFSVRCFKDEYDMPPQPVEITYDPNGGAFSGKAVNETTVVTYTPGDTYTPDIDIQFPNKAMEGETGYMFDGWYTSATDQTSATEWLGYVDSSTHSQTVYAKWLPFENKTVDLGEIGSFNIMDRNMGAEAVSDGAYNNTTANLLGYYYQWGNNYGFKNSGSVPYSVTTQIDITGKGYGPGNYYSSATFVKYGGKWDIDNSTSTYTSYGNLNLWGGENTSNPDSWRQGPCPENYHVPDTLEWKAAYELFKSWANTTAGQAYCATFTDDNATYRPKCFASKLALPFAGFRFSNGSNVISQGTDGGYWSSSPNPSDADYSYYFYFYSSNVGPQHDFYRAYGFSVRCFKNSSTKTLTFSRNGEAVDTKNVRRWDVITGAYKPTFSVNGATETWYTDADKTQAFTFGDSAYVTENTTLYSDITCSDSSKEWNGTACVSKPTATFNANGGEITTGSVQVSSGTSLDLTQYTATKADYEFIGWNTNSGATTKIGDSYEVNGDVTLYAIFKKTPRVWTIESGDFGALDITGTDGKVLFTIMDRNLGAEAYMNEDGKTASQWYGKYYQWGNNYGFTNDGNITVDDSQVDASEYGPNNYYSSSTFITAYSDWSLVNNKNLWGGSGDSVSNRGPGTDEDRQGPCPSGYHVPDILEWKAATKTWCKEKMGQADGQCNNGDNFRDDLLLPFAGYRDRYGAGVYGQGSYGYYWSSSPYPSNSSISYYLDFSSSHMYADSYGSRAYGYSVRCFKNTTGKTITYVLNNGTNNPSNPDSTVRRWEEGTTLLSGTRDGYTFKGWYTNPDFTGDAVTTNAITDNSDSDTITLYAKWEKDPRVWTIESGDFRALDITGTDGKVLFTIMDRNLGAEAYMGEAGKEASQWYGKYYQWGNNYGFPNTGDITIDGSLVDTTGYGPDNYYSSSTFITGNGNWSSVNNKNLWGGENTSNPDSYRQGPCPSGYHVPDTLEWKAAVAVWCTKKRGGASATACNDRRVELQRDLLLPFAGGRFNSNSNVYDQVSLGFYWSSSPNPSNANDSYYLSFNSSKITPQNNFRRTSGHSVRCFKNTTGKTLTYELNSGTNAENNPTSTLRRWEEGTTLLSGTRDGYTFKGWYTTPGFEEGTEVTTNAITDNSDSDTITLYAKWEKTTRDWTIENGDFRALDITGTDGKVLFTIMDRNLGAEAYMNEPGKTASQWYGKYYQWGNNYGFPNTGSITTNGNRVDITAGHYGPNNYYSSSTFIKRSTSPYSWDIDTSNDTYTQYGNLNLWGGENTSNPDSRRQGPCPSGYHVPDSLEWKSAVTVWCTKKRGGANDTACNSQGTQLQTDLLLPFAGRRYYYNANINYQGIYGSYRSSSPNSSDSNNYSYGFDFSSSGIGPQDNYYRVYGFPVRCFKNTTGKTITYVLDGGANNPSNPTTSVRRWEDGITLLNATRDEYTFIGWYTTPGFEEGTRVTTNAIIDNSNSDTITLYAKWGKNPRDWTIDSGDFRALDITGTDGKVLFTIMDRNLGAIQAGTGENSYGYFYQRGNNYGFANIGSVTTSGSQVDTSGYGPDNYYSSSTFTKGNYKWSSVNNGNLWGGEKVYNSDVDRQGPCPSGYHVPDTLEWKAARETWCREKMGQINGQCNNGGNFRDDLLLPFAGSRYYYDASIESQDSNGYYWSSSPYPSNDGNSYYLYFRSSNINPQDYNARANGFSVRCFKDSQDTQTLTFDADNGEDNVVYNIRWWEPITKNYKFIPEKEGYKFVGWYEGNTEFNFSDTTFITKDTILKAKWEKAPWYTYNANGGRFLNGESSKIIKSKFKIQGISTGNDSLRTGPFINTIKYNGADYMHLEGKWSNTCVINLKIYNYDRKISQTGEPYYIYNYDGKGIIDIDIPGDTISIENDTGSCGYAPGYNLDITIFGPNVFNEYIEIPSRQGYTFSGWYETGDNRPFNFTGTEVTQDRTLYAKWNPNHYTIQLDINEGTGEVSDINATYGEEITLPIVTREGYRFKGWQSEDGTLYSDVIPEGTPLTTQDGAIVILTAQWESDQEPSNNNYSGGGRKNSSSDSDSETHGSADEKDSVEKSEDTSLDENTSSKNESPKLQELDMKKYDNNYPEEQNQAYQFAYKNGITTQSTIKSARMNTELTRIQMAKMLSNYAINIMGQEPDLSKGMIKFNDVPSKLDLQYDNAVTKAYQLGIMGQNMKNNEFRPNDKVTRAEFATALSRLLYKTEEGKYKGTGKYYEPHIAKLYNEGIISKTDPSIKEKRGYVMTMLMRTVK